MRALVSGVGDLKHHVVGKVTLDVEVPLLVIGRSHFSGPGGVEREADAGHGAGAAANRKHVALGERVTEEVRGVDRVERGIPWSRAGIRSAGVTVCGGELRHAV